MSPDSGNGAELYVVTGHSPRHLDRNVVLVGRVMQGMELLTTLPRGTGPLGFYESKDEQVAIESIRFASDLPEDQRVGLKVLRTDTETFRQLVEARRYRAEDWFVDPADNIGLCNVPIPVRAAE
jgi:peptidylprolyl isomerase